MESWKQNLSFPEELEQLRAQVAALTRRVAALEQGAGTFSGAARSADLPAQPRREERRVGLTAVNRIGAITLALGILFFFKYAADNHWIGPVGRLIAGVIAGLCFLGFGERLRRAGQEVLALGITGCGFAILYITAYASSVFYKLLLEGASFFLMVCASGLAVGLAIRAKSQTLAAAGFAGAFLTTILLHGRSHSRLDLIYLLGFALAGIVVAVPRHWPFLVVVNTVLAVLSGFATDNSAGAVALFCLAMAAMHWAAQARAGEPGFLVDTLYVCGHALLLVAGLRFISAWTSETSIALTVASILLALYGTALLSLGVARQSNVNRLTGLTLIGLVIGKLYLYDIWQLSYGFRITAFVVLGALLLGASFIYSRWKAQS